MKKLLVLATAAVMFLGMAVSCNSNKKAEPASAQTESTCKCENCTCEDCQNCQNCKDCKGCAAADSCAADSCATDSCAQAHCAEGKQHCGKQAGCEQQGDCAKGKHCNDAK